MEGGEHTHPGGAVGHEVSGQATVDLPGVAGIGEPGLRGEGIGVQPVQQGQVQPLRVQGSDTAPGGLDILRRGQVGDGPASRQGRQFQGLRRLEEIRAGEPCFDAGADVSVEDSGDNRVLALGRRAGDRELICLFNFSGSFVQAGVDRPGSWTELMYGTKYENIRSIELWPNGFAWLLRENT